MAISPDDRAELDKLRKLKRLSELEAKAGNQTAAEPPGGRFIPEPWPVNPNAGINPIKGTAEQVLSGATLGLTDEIQAAIGAVTTSGQAEGEGLEPMSYLERYVLIRDKQREDRKKFIEQEGLMAYVPEAIGGLATGLTGLAKSGGYVAAGGVGALEGGIAGAGYTDSEDFVSPETAYGAGTGAAVGAVAGPVMLGAGRIAKKGASALANKTKQAFPNISGAPKKAAEQIAENSGVDDEMARYIFKDGKAIKDPLYREAAKQGIPDATINSIKALSPAERKEALKMLKVIEIGKSNTNFAKANRAGDTVGARFEDTINYVGDINQKARLKLSGYVKKNLNGAKIDIDDALKDFISDIDDLGINVTASKKNWPSRHRYLRGSNKPSRQNTVKERH